MIFKRSIVRFFLPLAGLAFLSAPLRAESTTQPNALPSATEFPSSTVTELVKIIGLEGTLKDNTYTISIPRNDLDLYNENGTIPIAAGIASTFSFYKCPCGKINAIGQFVVPDYESNDVIDALRKRLHIQIVSIAPMLIGEKPKLLIIRFQGEGAADELAESLKAALDCTGEARMTTRPIEK